MAVAKGYGRSVGNRTPNGCANIHTAINFMEPNGVRG
jgi:hypothetical protein